MIGFLKSFLAYCALVIVVALASRACESTEPQYYVDYPDDSTCAGPRSLGC